MKHLNGITQIRPKSFASILPKDAIGSDGDVFLNTNNVGPKLNTQLGGLVVPWRMQGPEAKAEP